MKRNTEVLMQTWSKECYAASGTSIRKCWSPMKLRAETTKQQVLRTMFAAIIMHSYDREVKIDKYICNLMTRTWNYYYENLMNVWQWSNRHKANKLLSKQCCSKHTDVDLPVKLPANSDFRVVIRRSTSSFKYHRSSKNILPILKN